MFKPALLAAALVVAGAVAAPAATVQFTPTNDALGRIFTTNSNDGWKDGRGIGFQVASTQTITSVGVMQDLKRKWLNFGIYEISSLTGSPLLTGSASLPSSHPIPRRWPEPPNHWSSSSRVPMCACDRSRRWRRSMPSCSNPTTTSRS